MKLYKIRKGDTLKSIAEMFQTSVDKILHDNQTAYPLIGDDYFFVGWVLEV